MSRNSSAAAYHNIWNRRSLQDVMFAMPTIPRCGLPVQPGAVSKGRGDYQSFVLSIMAMFPDLALQIDDIYWMGNDDDGYLVSVRWSILGHMAAMAFMARQRVVGSICGVSLSIKLWTGKSTRSGCCSTNSP